MKLATRYITDRFLPDKAIDVIDEAGAMVQLAPRRASASVVVDASHVADVVAQWTGVPVRQLSEDESATLLNIEGTLSERVVGQTEAVTAISRAVRRARSGLRTVATDASMIFAGPTGVGKTELAKAVAQSYYGAEKSMVRIDMSEYRRRRGFPPRGPAARVATTSVSTGSREAATSRPATPILPGRDREGTPAATCSTSCSRCWRMAA